MGPPSAADPAVNGQPPKLQSVQIALDIIDALAEAPELGVSDLARRVGIAKSTAHRTCAVLAERGLLDRTTDGAYRLGLRLVEYGGLATERTAIRDRGLPLSRRAAQRLGETVQIGVAAGADVVYVERVEGRRALRYSTNCAEVANPPFQRRQGSRRVRPGTRRGPPARRSPAEYRLHDRRSRRCSSPSSPVCANAATPAASTRPRSACPRWRCRCVCPDDGPVVAAISMVGPTARVVGEHEAHHASVMQAGARKLSASIEKGEYSLRRG